MEVAGAPSRQELLDICERTTSPGLSARRCTREDAPNDLPSRYLRQDNGLLEILCSAVWLTGRRSCKTFCRGEEFLLNLIAGRQVKNLDRAFVVAGDQAAAVRGEGQASWAGSICAPRT